MEARYATRKQQLLAECQVAPEVFDQGFENLFYAAPAVADDHYKHLAEHILAMPEGQRPKTVAYAAMDDPFAQGTAYGLKAKMEEAGIKTVVDEVYPPNTTDFGSIAADGKAGIADLGVAHPIDHPHRQHRQDQPTPRGDFLEPARQAGQIRLRARRYGRRPRKLPTWAVLR